MVENVAQNHLVHESKDSADVVISDREILQIPVLGWDINRIENKIDTIISQHGWINAGKVDFDLKQIYQGNDWEGYRLGIGTRTSYQFNPRFQLNARVNYGTRDNKFKYGIGTSYLVDSANYSSVHLAYHDDVMPAGRFSFHHLSFGEVFGYRATVSNHIQYIKEKKGSLAFSTLLHNNLNVSLLFSLARQQSLFPYAFKDNTTDNIYQENATTLDLKWEPKSVYTRNTMGRYLIENNFPVYHLSVEKGWNLNNDNQEFVRLNFSGRWELNLLPKNITFALSGGKVWGEVPLWQYFEGGSKQDLSPGFFNRFLMGGSQAFETMLPGEFFSDQYLILGIRQNVLDVSIIKGKPSQFHMVYKIGIGSIENIQNHQLIQFKEMNHSYQEIGLEWNRILFNIFGIGAYYRIGEYHTGKFNNDFALKGTLNF